jgi:hypothetical protein
MRRTRTSRARAVSAETTTPQSTAIMTTIGMITTLILLWLIIQ